MENFFCISLTKKNLCFIIFSPKLTWRDIQHIVVHTANWLPLKRDPDWRMNGIGLHVNEKFGFGLLDSERIVHIADRKSFRTVPSKTECKGRIFSSSRYGNRNPLKANPTKWSNTLK